MIEDDFDISEEEQEMIDNEMLNVSYQNSITIEMPVFKNPSIPGDQYSNKTVSSPTVITSTIRCGFEAGVNSEIGPDKTLAYLKNKTKRKLNFELNKIIKDVMTDSEQQQLANGRAI